MTKLGSGKPCDLVKRLRDLGACCRSYIHGTFPCLLLFARDSAHELDGKYHLCYREVEKLKSVVDDVAEIRVGPRCISAVWRLTAIIPSQFSSISFSQSFTLPRYPRRFHNTFYRTKSNPSSCVIKKIISLPNTVLPANAPNPVTTTPPTQTPPPPQTPPSTPPAGTSTTATLNDVPANASCTSV